MVKQIPTIEGTGSTVASDGDVLANDFTLFPLHVVGNDLRD